MGEIDKTPVTVNGYRISFDGEKWQAVKNGEIHKTHLLKQPVVQWANNH